jgi:26S proteasome regulatory subunit N2
VFQNGVDKVLEDRVKHLQAILGGETTIGYHLEFLIRNNHADLLILKNTKVWIIFKIANELVANRFRFFTDCHCARLL